MNLVMNLPDAIRHARKELGLSQAALSRLSGVHRPLISALESGRNVTLSTVRRVLRHLPNVQTFTLDAAAVEVNRTPSGDWNDGALAAAAFLSRACRHVVDHVTRGDAPAAEPVLLLNEPES